MSATLDLVKEFSPAVCFHEHESYFPCSIEHLLHNATLQDRDREEWSLANPTKTDLQEHHTPNYWVSISPSQFSGVAPPGAPMYYAVQEYKDVIQLSYLMLYAYQGGQTCRALRVFSEFNCIVKTLGIHEGDLERVIVTLLPKKSGGYQVLNVGYEAHGEVTYYPPQRVKWDEGQHPVVNVALSGHSSHNMYNNNNCTVTEFEQPGMVAIISALSDKGKVWRPWSNNQFLQLGLDAAGAPFGDQVWAIFQGRLGKRQRNTVVSATHFDGSHLPALDFAFVKMINWVATVCKKYPQDVLNSNGPAGPGDRAWIKPVSGNLYDALLMRFQAVDNVEEGTGAVKWLSGRFTSAGCHAVVQCCKIKANLGMKMYGVKEGNILQKIWGSDNMHEGSGAVHWAVGNFLGNDRHQIIQCWNNRSSLGMIMYGADGDNAIKKVWGTGDIGGRHEVIYWAVGDFNGDGKDEIVQCWKNDFSLGMIMYGTKGDTIIHKLWGCGDISKGTEAVHWAVGDFNGDGKAEIAQCWKNGPSLGMIIYGAAKDDNDNAIYKLWETDCLCEGADAVYWAVGDFNGDGKAEIVQCWKNGSSLGMTMYGTQEDNSMHKLWGSDNMEEGPGAVYWAVGHFSSTGKDQILQCWDNNSSLGIIVYGTMGDNTMVELWGTGNMQEAVGALYWAVGDFNADGKDEIMQCWNNESRLAMVLYASI